MISAKLVKELRDRTGAGMMDCKKALTENDGDMDKAIDFLRTKGLAAAAKRAGRVAAEGLVLAQVKGEGAAVVEVNSETDFVARNEKFQEFVQAINDHIIANKPANNDELMTQPMEFDGKTLPVKDTLTGLISTIRENIQFRRFAFLPADGGTLAAYTHSNSKIGVIMRLTGAAQGEGVEEIGKELCMQVAALKAQYVRSDDIPADVADREKAIFKAQAMESGKPEHIAEKIVIGRMRKFFAQVCLLDQAYMRDDKMTVKQFLQEKGKELGKELDVDRFFVFRLAEDAEQEEE